MNNAGLTLMNCLQNALFKFQITSVAVKQISYKYPDGWTKNISTDTFQKEIISVELWKIYIWTNCCLLQQRIWRWYVLFAIWLSKNPFTNKRTFKCSINNIIIGNHTCTFWCISNICPYFYFTYFMFFAPLY